MIAGLAAVILVLAAGFALLGGTLVRDPTAGGAEPPAAERRP